MQQQQYNKPLPYVHEETRPFWEGTKRHEVLIQRCKDCGKFRFYPRSTCIYCLSDNTEWVKVSGKAKVYSFTIAYRPARPAFADDAPYNVAIIELEEGIRMISNIVDCANEDIKVDMPVEVVFDDVTPEITLLKFKPVS
ncbi:MAG: Zn-ribbon domain-containing OB-fold protein [Dehalococcoidales bacterium]